MSKDTDAIQLTSESLQKLLGAWTRTNAHLAELVESVVENTVAKSPEVALLLLDKVELVANDLADVLESLDVPGTDADSYRAPLAHGLRDVRDRILLTLGEKPTSTQ